MMRIIFSPEATFELTEASTSYDMARPGLGRGFLNDIDYVLSHIGQHPMSTQAIGRGFRRAVLHRFPFCIVYRVHADEIRVVSVAPTRADPARLFARLEPTIKNSE